MRVTILPLAFFLSVVIFLGSCNTAYAMEEIGQSRIHPAHPLYFLKTICESLELKFAGTPRTVLIRKLEFATRRLREVNSLAKAGNFELIIPTMEKYSSRIASLPDQGIEDQELVLIIENNLSNHLEVLQMMNSQIEDSRAKMSIRAAINKIIQRADLTPSTRLKGCEFLSKEASSSALNEVEKEILLQRAQKCRELMPETYSN